MLSNHRRIWMAFVLWAIALIIVMAGLTIQSSPLLQKLFVTSKTMPDAYSALPHATPMVRVGVRLFVQWMVVVMAIGAVGLLLHVALDLSERRKQFVSAVTHELRTPLTTMRMYTEMLEGGLVQGEDKKMQYIRTLRLETGRLQQLIDNVLTHARLDEDRMEQHVEPAALGDVVESIRPRLEDRCAQVEMKLAAEFHDDTDQAMVSVDALALERILYNLVDNACKYAAGAADKTILMEMRAQGNRLLLEITDRGPGIDAADAALLFNAFQHGRKSRTGIGLGLSISRRLARQMGGELALDTECRQGCRMVLSLPRSPE